MFGTSIALLSAYQEHKELVMNRKALPLFALLITLIGITAGANAQTRRKVTLEASVPFEFVVGNRVFPAGSYVFEMATGHPKTTDQAGVLVVHNRERKLYAAVATDVTTDANAHVTPKVIFTRSGDRVFLSKVWRQGNAAGLSLHAPAGTEGELSQESQVLTLDAVAMNGEM
jgi:hypothetical protein